MGRNSIRVVIILATLSVLGIILIQFFFLKSTVDINERKFHDSTTNALKNVAQELVNYNTRTNGYANNIDIDGAIDQISNNYYIVNVNDEINPFLLEHFLTDELKKANIDIDFTYAIYDCETKQMVYRDNENNGDEISNDPDQGCTMEDVFFESHYKQRIKEEKSGIMPVSNKYTYYFGVTFPNRSQYYNSQISAWYWVNGFLLIVILFFGYTLYVIFKQRRLSEIQKNFINNLTHEFKTPISAIDLSSKVIADPHIIDHPKRLVEYSRIIGEQTNRLSLQVEKVLQMASIQKQVIQLDKENIDLNEFLEKTVADFRASQNGDEYKLELDIPETIIKIDADKLHFSNIIFNILDNAFKYSDETPSVKLKVLKKKKKTEIYIEDNGIGIPKEYRKKIFNRFFRIPTGDIHNVKGFGLGLDYVKKIVNRHGWKIEVNDNSAKGSIFIITIPE